jgi:hypothetical protein
VFHGFPSFLPAPALSEMLWNDIPYDLEPRFGGVFESSDRDRDSLPRVAGKSSTDRTVESGDQDNGSPGTDRDEKSRKTGHLHSGMLPIWREEGLIPNSCIDSGQPSDPDTMQIDDPPPLCCSPRLARLSAHALLDDGTTDEGGTQVLMALLNSQIDEIEIECDKPNFDLILSKLVDAEVAFVGAALTEPIDDMDAKDPRTVQEAKSSIYWSYWLAAKPAIHEELESLKAKGVYDEVSELPPGWKAVDSKWVLHIKRDRDGRILRFKARLVAKGFTQIPGQDFVYTFAPVAQWESIHILLTLAATLNMEVRQVDVKTAFLNSPLDEEIYLRIPLIVGSGFWRLRKGLYGLKQAGRQWYIELNSKLESIGFKRTESDWSVYVRHTDTGMTILTTSVDDMLIASTTTAKSDMVVKQLAQMFEITDNKEPTLHLGCGVQHWRDQRKLKLDQQSYSESILRDFGFENCKSVTTPMDPGTRLTPSHSPPSKEDLRKTNGFPYTAVVGKLMYLATCTRPNIAYAVRELARFMSNYGPPHVAAAKHLLRYLKGTTTFGIILGNADRQYPMFRALTDSDWGMGDERKSISGYLITLGDSPLSWSSKQQAVVALSSCEAEYLASTHCAREVLWFRNLFAELGFPQSSPTTIFCDNQGTVACTRDPHAHSKMKHISIREHFIRDCVMKRLIDVVYISNKENIADLFTKPLPRIMHTRWVKMLRLDAGQGGVSDDDRATKP